MYTCIDWWNDKRREIALLESSASLKEFHTWPPVIATMWPNTDGYAVHQIKFLSELPDWKTRWLPAMKDKLAVTECQWWTNVSFASINHAYNLAHFETITGINLDKMNYIFEFGAGTGNMCRIIHNLGFAGRYEIYDFPEMRVLQRFFIQESGVDISSIHWADNMDDIIIPNSGKRLAISIAAIEEASQDFRIPFLELGKKCTHFLTGGQLMVDVHIDLREAMKNTIWTVWDTHIPPGYYIGIGAPK